MLTRLSPHPGPRLPFLSPQGGRTASSRSRLSQRRKAAACEPVVDIARLQLDCPLVNTADNGRCKALVLNNVCMVQETFVVYDPENADRNPNGLMRARAPRPPATVLRETRTHTPTPLPRAPPEHRPCPPPLPHGPPSAQFPTDDFDVTDLKYWFRQAQGGHLAPLLNTEAARANNLTAQQAGDGELVLGHELAIPKIVSRFAASHEIDKDPEFEECETPVVIYSGWTMNVGETMALIPPMVFNLHSHGAFRNRNVRFAIPTPQKLPLEPFNEWTIQPYSDHKPVSFAELSALRFANGSSHEACFRQVVLLKVIAGNYPEIPRAADKVWEYYKDKARDPGAPIRLA